MKRVIYLEDTLNNNKYVLKTTYDGHGIYQRCTPSGYPVHQDWAVQREDGFTFTIQSYNNICYYEVLDAIDNYAVNKKYGLKAIQTEKGLEHGYYTVHPSGKEI